MGCFTSIAAIGLHLASYHSEQGYNNVNPGAYVSTPCGRGFTLDAGAYYNSYKRLSVHAGYTYDVQALPLFVAGGVATGYSSKYSVAGMAIKPYAMVGVRAKAGDYRLRVGYVPKINGMNKTHIVHFMVERVF